MGQIYAVGETILDIIFKDRKPVASKPGGSSFNAAISMGRLGLPITFISELGDDLVGNIIIDFLKENHVVSDYISRFDHGQTAIALAFLNKNNDAEYQFYKDYPFQRLNVTFPEFTGSDYVLFGSFYALNPGIRPKVKELLDKASNAGSLIIYDPNFRDSHMNEKDQLLEIIKENMGYADMIRASDEDLRNIFGVSKSLEAWEFLKPLCNVLVCTASSGKILLKTNDIEMYIDVESIIPVSTIGAGDTFNAGLVYGLYKRGISAKDLGTLDRTIWTELIKMAAGFSKEVCLSYDNYISVDFASKYMLTGDL